MVVVMVLGLLMMVVVMMELMVLGLVMGMVMVERWWQFFCGVNTLQKLYLINVTKLIRI